MTVIAITLGSAERFRIGAFDLLQVRLQKNSNGWQFNGGDTPWTQARPRWRCWTRRCRSARRSAACPGFSTK